MPLALTSRSIGIDARILGARLGLGDLDLQRPCHGYANACDCTDCADRADAEARLRDMNAAKRWERELEDDFARMVDRYVMFGDSA